MPVTQQAIPVVDGDCDWEIRPLGLHMDSQCHISFHHICTNTWLHHSHDCPQMFTRYCVLPDVRFDDKNRLTKVSCDALGDLHKLFSQTGRGAHPPISYGHSVHGGWRITLPPNLFYPNYQWILVDITSSLPSESEHYQFSLDAHNLVFDLARGDILVITGGIAGQPLECWSLSLFQRQKHSQLLGSICSTPH